MSNSFDKFIHGCGIFLAHNHARLDFLDEAMQEDCKSINDGYDFFRFVMDHNGGYFSRDEFLWWFHSMWRFIPKEQLYNTYKELFMDMYLLKGYSCYPMFFWPDLLNEIMPLNRHDTIENPELTSFLDSDGYLTVYRGQVKENEGISVNSWTLNKNKAIHVGRVYTFLSDSIHNNASPTFYCVTGKVKLDDVITFIGSHKEHEIMVLQKNVKRKTKEMFNTKDYELKLPL